MKENFHVQKDDLLDTTDLTSVELEALMQVRLLKRESSYLRKIETAIRKISDGTFGKCEECEEEIGIKRLQARPTATLCVHCKEIQEKNERKHVHHNQRESRVGSTA
jgi:DnaK suppressor protein